MKTTCLRCGKGFEVREGSTTEPCPGCGTRDPRAEADLGTGVGRRGEYRILEERQGPGNVMTLMLVGTWNPQATAAVELNHRLLSDYRHMKGNLNLADGRDGVITFDVAAEGDLKGKWVISNLRRRTVREVRAEQTAKCRRHTWAVRASRESFDVNGPANKMHCSCPPPPCEVCRLATLFAIDRRRPGSDGTKYWADLQHAVLRDIGWLA